MPERPVRLPRTAKVHQTEIRWGKDGHPVGVPGASNNLVAAVSSMARFKVATEGRMILRCTHAASGAITAFPDRLARCARLATRVPVTSRSWRGACADESGLPAFLCRQSDRYNALI